MVYGATGVERLQLNDDSLWYGGFVERNNPYLKERLPEIRNLVLQRKMREAEGLIAKYFSAAPASMRHYTTLGELQIALNQDRAFIMAENPDNTVPADYSANLDLMQGIATIAYSQKGIRQSRELFASYNSNVICCHYTAEQTPAKGAIKLDIKFDRSASNGFWPVFLADECRTIRDNTLWLGGNAGGTLFGAAVRVVTDGTIENSYTRLSVHNASEVTLFVTASTSNREADIQGSVLHTLDEAEKKGYAEIKAEHIADFETEMRKCVLRLHTPHLTSPARGEGHLEPVAPLPLREGLGEGSDGTSSPADYFNFGRYLLLSGGRAGSAALNLQGIWCGDIAPAWDGKYTTNINIQMNYWPAEVTGLGHTHFSLFDLIKKTLPNGRKTAQVMYGCRGAVVHHNTDFYGDTAPQDVYFASTSWTMGGAWMALHLWEHYLYTVDKTFLKEWLPVMKEFALFFIDFLSDDGKGHLVTNPSVSPENRYYIEQKLSPLPLGGVGGGQHINITPTQPPPEGEEYYDYDTPICAGPAMDNQILRALFAACIEGDKILGEADPLCREFAEAAKKLPENKIGSKGQLLEWQEEEKEAIPGMSHISHLWAVYPGNQINKKDSPALLAAAKKSLEMRLANGAGDGGWPLAWYICQAARFDDGAMAGAFIDKMLATTNTRNFLNCVPGQNNDFIFQIDGNFGATAGIAECLMQSHLGCIELLPALPPSWKEGSVTGLHARGGHIVNIQWKEGKLLKAEIQAGSDGPIYVSGITPHLTSPARGEGQLNPINTEDGWTINAKKGIIYVIEGK
jgi:alpha-L-fucosidase 2